MELGSPGVTYLKQEATAGAVHLHHPTPHLEIFRKRMRKQRV
jgi:hypothetical protein